MSATSLGQGVATMTDLAIVSFALVVAGLLVVYRKRKLRITAFARHATMCSQSQRDAAFALARTIFSAVKRGNDPIFISRLLAPLGASPTRVLDKGGCCSGIHRLLITGLDTIGIRSAQITVYSATGVHCLVQAETDDEYIIIDADYGVWLRHPNGGAVNLRQLRAGVQPIIEPFVFDGQATYVDSVKTRTAGYPDRDYYHFDFSQTRTANWTMSAVRRVAYKALNPLTRGRVNYFLLPPILEWPEVLLALLLCSLAILLVAAHALYTNT
jgi:hypothetical protein